MWRGHGGCPAESWAGAGVENRRRQVAPRLHWQCRASVQTMQSLSALWTATRTATRMQRGAEQCRSASGMSSSWDAVHSFSAAHSIQLRQLPITMTTTKTTRLYSDAGWQQKNQKSQLSGRSGSGPTEIYGPDRAYMYLNQQIDQSTSLQLQLRNLERKRWQPLNSAGIAY